MSDKRDLFSIDNPPIVRAPELPAPRPSGAGKEAGIDLFRMVAPRPPSEPEPKKPRRPKAPPRHRPSIPELLSLLNLEHNILSAQSKLRSRLENSEGMEPVAREMLKYELLRLGGIQEALSEVRQAVWMYIERQISRRAAAIRRKEAKKKRK